MPQIKIWKGEIQRNLLPKVCAVCGEPTHLTKTRTFVWTPGWIILLIFVGWPILIIVYLILRRKMVVPVPVCEYHQGHWFRRSTLPGLAIFATLVFGIALAIFVGQAIPNGEAVTVVMLATLAGLVASVIFAGVMQRRCIRPAEITHDTITLQSVHEEFIAELEEDRERDEEEEREWIERRGSRSRESE